MRDVTRIDVICDNLAKVWKYFPDQRLGQFLENYVFNREGMMFYQEDDQTLETLMTLLDECLELDK